MWETWVWFLSWEDPLEKGKATHSSILAWRILWIVQPWPLKELNTTERLSLSTFHWVGRSLPSVSFQHEARGLHFAQSLCSQWWSRQPQRPARKELLLNSAAAAAAAASLQSCLTLCNPIDDSPPGSPIPGILQARTLEWVAIAFSREREFLPLPEA